MTIPQHQSADATRRERTGSAFVVGGGPVGQEVANRLTERGEAVTFVDRAPPTDPPPGQSVHHVDALTGDALRDAGLHEAAAVLVLEPDDAANLLVAQLARTRFDADRVVVRVNDPDRTPAFETLDVEPFDTAAAVACAVVEEW